MSFAGGLVPLHAGRPAQALLGREARWSAPEMRLSSVMHPKRCLMAESSIELQSRGRNRHPPWKSLAGDGDPSGLRGRKLRVCGAHIDPLAGITARAQLSIDLRTKQPTALFQSEMPPHPLPWVSAAVSSLHESMSRSFGGHVQR